MPDRVCTVRKTLLLFNILISSLYISIIPGCNTLFESDPYKKDSSPLARLASDIMAAEIGLSSSLLIGEFLYQGKQCDLGEETAASLPALLRRHNSALEITSLKDLKAVLDSQKLLMKDIFADSGVAPGMMPQAENMIMGFFFQGAEKEVILEAQIVSIRSGEILRAARTSFPNRCVKVMNPFADLPLEVEFLAIAKSNGEDGLKLVRQGDRLRTGDMLRIRLKPNRPAYLYCFLLDSQGDAKLLYPKKKDAPYSVDSSELLLPSSIEYYRLDAHTGNESILVAASVTPLKDVDTLLVDLAEEAAKTADLMKALRKVGEKGFVGISRPIEDGDLQIGEIMRSYSGVVWRKLDFYHLP